MAAIDTSYTDLGQVYQVTSVSATAHVVNQVEDAYDGWGNLTQEWQAVSGSVNTSSTPSVQYNYADGANSNGVAQYVRLASVVYPNAVRTLD